MIKLLRSILFISVFSFGLLSTANANLEVRPGGMVYDDVLNITWLADANYATTSGYDSDGRMSWDEAMTWAASLNVGGVSDWHLPTADTTCYTYNCTNSEMGHLFYNELGGTAMSSVLTSSDPDVALFTNILGAYWSLTEWEFNPDYSWFFDFSHGYQNVSSKDYLLGFAAWAVHDGDVGLIPEPEMYAMLSIGLLAMFGFGRLSRQS